MIWKIRNSHTNGIYRFLSISKQEYLLFIEAFLWIILCQTALLIPFRLLTPYLGTHMLNTPYIPLPAKLQKKVSTISIAINRAVYYMPWKVKCLVQAMAGKFMLKHRKIESTLYLGVVKNNEIQIKAHAWLRCGDQIVCGEQGIERFTVISIFGR